MPWKCRKHQQEIFDEPEKEKPGKCPKCKDDTFVYWDTGTVEITGGTLLTTEGSGTAKVNVYVEHHQGKHVDGTWPSYNGKKGSKFTLTLVSAGNKTFLLELWNKIKGGVTSCGQGYGYVYIDCGTRPVGTKGETYVTVQWSKIANNYSFHAYPEAIRFSNKKYVVL